MWNSIKNLTRGPTHLAGCIGTNGRIVSSCSRFAAGYPFILSRVKITFNPEKVTCNSCLKVIKEGKERDPHFRSGRSKFNNW